MDYDPLKLAIERSIIGYSVPVRCQKSNSKATVSRLLNEFGYEAAVNDICGIVSEQLASRDAELARLRDEVERITRQWAVMARAVGNWREIGQVNPDTDQTERDWLVAAQAIVDAESLRSEVKELKDKLLREQVARYGEV